MIGPPQGHPAMGNYQTGGLLVGKQSVPQLTLGVYIEGAGEVVKHQQLDRAGPAGQKGRQ